MKTKSLITILAVIVFLTPLPAFAWDHTGHMIVAQIAFNQLTTKAKRSSTLCLVLPSQSESQCALSLHGASYPTHTTERSLA